MIYVVWNAAYVGRDDSARRAGGLLISARRGRHALQRRVCL
jgi:hypothetical protein